MTKKVGYEKPEPSVMLRIAQRLSANLDLPALLENLMNSAQELTQSDAASVLLFDEKLGKLRFYVATGRAAARLLPLTVPRDGSSIAGWVFEHKSPLLCNDVTREDRWYPKVDERSGFKTRSILCAPLVASRRSIGVIQVLNKERFKGFGPEDEEILLALAQLAAQAIENRLQYEDLWHYREQFEAELEPRYRIVGRHERLCQALTLAEKVAPAPTTVLITGESGTGKELLARHIHRRSPRRDGPFVVVNCAAIPATLIESELFGYERGAFTGALARRLGKFELAHHGTLFLDEIGDLALETQVKILRFFDEHVIQRLGSKETLTLDVRILAATNHDLKELVKNKEFREDLYYRLNVFPIQLPPLRERKEDIAPLAQHFIKLLNQETTKKVKGLTRGALSRLENYDWPGNIRELRNVVERGFVLASYPKIKEEDILLMPSPGLKFPDEVKSWSEAVRSFKRYYLKKVLESSNYNHRAVANLLGIQPSYLSRLKKELQV
jgi:Nif-specific regulatory protein